MAVDGVTNLISCGYSKSSIKKLEVVIPERWLILVLIREIILYRPRATGCGIATLVYERHPSPGVCSSCSHLHLPLLCLAAQASDAIPPWCPAPQYIHVRLGSSLCMGLRGRS